jgi:tetratricopeptide (TPR) repeat protein
LNALIKDKKYSMVKIHGAKKNIITGEDTSASLITTISSLGKDREKGETFAIEGYKKPLVNAILNNRTLVVMGYSGSDDFSIGPLLNEFPNLNKIIWMEHADTNLEIYKIQKADASSKKGVYPKSATTLSTLSKKFAYEIDYLVGRTSDIISKEFSPLFSIRPGEGKIVPKADCVVGFEEWVRTVYPDISEIKKFGMTSLIFSDLANPERCLSVSERGKVLAEKKRDDKSLSFFLGTIGLIYDARGDYDNALKHYQESLRIAEQLGNLSIKAVYLNNIGMIYRVRGDYENALKHYQEALRIAEQLGNLKGKAAYLNTIGQTYKDRGDYENALKHYQEALRIAEQLGNLSNKATYLNNIGAIYDAREDSENALKSFEDALQIDEQLGDTQGKKIRLQWIEHIKNKKIKK